MKCPNCNAAIENNWLICPGCGLDLSPLEKGLFFPHPLERQVDEKLDNIHQPQVLPALRIEKKMGSCLTTWLILVLITNSVLGLIALALSSGNNVTDNTSGISALIAFGSAICAFGALNWKKWSVIGLAILIVIGNLILINSGNLSGIFSLIVQLGLLIGLTNKSYHLFE